MGTEVLVRCRHWGGMFYGTVDGYEDVSIIVFSRIDMLLPQGISSDRLSEGFLGDQ